MAHSWRQRGERALGCRKEETNKEPGTSRGRAGAVKKFTILCFQGLWKTLELWPGKAMKCCKRSLMGDSRGILEDTGSESCVLWRPSL